MRCVIQRVTSASVAIDGQVVGQCGRGYMILIGVSVDDTEKDLQYMATKIPTLRIFEDENGKMNKSVQDIDGEMLVVSQFTLLANYKHGNRPDYLGAAAPAEANRLYELFVEKAKAYVKHVGHGQFGADMQVSLVNDGPVTIVMDSDVLAPAPRTQK